MTVDELLDLITAYGDARETGHTTRAAELFAQCDAAATQLTNPQEDRP